MKPLFRLTLVSLALVFSLNLQAQELKGIVPVAGSTPGAFSGNFRTELQLNNPTGETLSGTIVFHPAGQAGSASDPSLAYQLLPHETRHFADIVAAMGREGLGSLDIRSDGPLPGVVARAFQDDGANGTKGVTLPVLQPDEVPGLQQIFVLIAPRDFTRFRFNIGVRSLSDGARLSITVYRNDGTVAGTAERTYAADFFTQQPANDVVGLTLQASDSISIKVLEGSAIVYGTTTDNLTNDPSFQWDDRFNSNPVFDPVPNVQASAGHATSVAISATDADGDAMQFRIINPPGNGTVGAVTVVGGTATFVFTPNAGFTGSDQVTIEVDDGNGGTNQINVALNVGSNQSPSATPGSVTTNEDQRVVITLRGADPELGPLTFTITVNPLHGTLTTITPTSANVAVVSYTPHRNFNGTDRFTFMVTDASGASSTAVVNITVNPVNDDPLASPDNFSTNEDVTLNVPAPGVLGNDVDVDGHAMTASQVSGTTNGALTLNPNGSFTYVPNPDFFGTDSFTYMATDSTGANSATVTVSLTINSVNDIPSFTIGADQSVPEDAGPQTVPNWISVFSAGPANESTQTTSFEIAAMSGNNPALFAAGPSIAPDGTLSYTPAANESGVANISVRIVDNGGTANGGVDTSAVQTFTITVTSVNDLPVANADSYSTDEDVALIVPAPGVLANDTDGEGSPLNAVLVTGPTNALTFALNADGSFNYTPAANFNGTDSFTYHANDGTGNSADVTVTITVNALNDAPVAVDDAYGVLANQTLNVPAPGVLANDTDVEGGITAVLVSGPTFASSFTLNGDGSFTYANNGNPATTDTFTYRANDGTTDSNIATVTITVTHNAAPVGVDDAYFVDEGGTLNVGAPGVLGNDTDVEGDPMTAVLVSGPANSSSFVLNADGSFDYTHNGGETTSDSFTYTPSDAIGGAGNTTMVSITINPINDAPVAVNDSYNVAEDTPLNVAALGVLGNDTDAEANSLTAVLNVGPTNALSFTLNPDGSFDYQPGLNFVGIDTFTYHANDGTVNSNIATATITVGASNDAPVAGDDAYNVLVSGTLDVVAPGVLANDSDVEGPITAVLVSGPTHHFGSFTLNPDGSFTYVNNGDAATEDTFTYQANDGVANSNIATVTITVMHNSPPVGVNDAYSGVDEAATLNVPALTGVLVNDTDPDGDPFTAVLVTGPANASSFTLNADGSFSYVHNGSETTTDSFTYQPTDAIAGAGNLTTVTITINAVNDAPVAVADSYSTDEEVTLNVTAPGVLGNDTDADNPSLNAILVTGPSNAAPLGFTLNSDGSFTYTPAADFSGSDSFQYKANDGAVDSNTVTVTITVNSIDDAPTDIALSNATIAENQPAGTAVGTFTTTDPDGTPHTYTLVAGAGDTDNASFQIVGDQLRSAAVFDFEVKSSYSIRVRSTDTTALSFEEQFTITVTDANEAPTDIALSNATLNENQPAGTLVGLLSTIDPDAADTFTYTLVAGAGDTGNASFQIVGNQLQTSGPLNFEATPTLSVRIRSTDSGAPPLFIEEAFIITVTDLNEPPIADDDSFVNVIGNTEHQVGGGSGPSAIIFHTHASDENPFVGDTDPDTNPAFNTISIVPVTNADTNAGGKISIDADGSFTYTPPPGVTGVNSDFYDYTLTDGSLTDVGRLNFTITNMVWYVKNDDIAGPFEGTSTDPFNELSDGGSDALADDAEDASTSATPSTVYVFRGTGTNAGMSLGIALDLNQKLIGEAADLIVGGVTLRAATPGSYPVISNSGGDGASIIANATTDNSIRGLSISGSGGAGNGIDLTATAGTVDLTVDDVFVTGSVQEGIDINAGGGTVTANLSKLNVTASTTGIDMTVTAGTGRIATFSNIIISGNTTGSGIIMNGVRFDADADAGNDSVVTGPLNIGSVVNPVGLAGAVLNTMTGGLDISSIVSASDSGAAFHLSATSSFDLTIGSGILDANAGGPGLSLNTVDAAISNLEVDSSNSSSNGITLTNVTGNVTLTSESHIENAGTADFNISGGNANVTYNGTITDDQGQLVEIASSTGGTKLFTGAITDNFDGDGGIGGEGSIQLTSNGATTITFSGGLSVSTANNAAFNATGGGTLNVCAVNPCGGGGSVVNRLQTTTGTALNVSATNIGANDLTFQSIAANGASSGIILNGTGSAGGLTVTGTGAADSGGTIQNTTGDGISLNNTRDVSLTELQISSSGDNAVDATSVINLTLDSVDIATTANMGILGATVTDFKFQNGSTMTGAGNGANESGIEITDLLGANNAITNSSVTGSQTQNVRITNNVSTAGTLTISGSTFSNTSLANGSDAVSIIGNNTANLTVNMTGGNNLNNTQGDGIQVSANNSANVAATINGATSNYNGNLGSAVNIAASGSATITATVSGFTGVSTGTSSANGLNVFNIQNFDTSTINATVQNNSITGLGNNASGIRVIQESNGTINVNINNNNISGMVANGIVAQARAGTLGNGRLNMTLGPSNVINLASALALDGVSIESGSSAGGDTNTVCLNMFNNSSAAAAQQGYRLRQRPGTTFNLQNFAGNGAIAGDITAWVNTTKSNTGTTDIVIGTAFSNAPSNCTTP